jgi:hypothetical protein
MLQYAMYSQAPRDIPTMPALNNPRHEALARALSRGVSVREANAEAGLSRRRVARAIGLSMRSDIVARVEELREAAEWGEAVGLKPLYEQAMRFADEAVKLETPPAMMAAKALLTEAARIKQGLARSAPQPAVPAAPVAGPAPPPARPVLSKEEWLAAFAPKSGGEP